MKLIPLAEDSKVPEEGTTIKSTISDDPRLHQEWMRDKNIGFPLEENTVVVADFDGDKEKKISGMDLSREFYRVNKDICKVMVETRRGIHFYFSGTAKTRKIVIDGTRVGDIKGNGYVVFPPSVVDGWQYRFVQGFKDFTKLAPFPAHLFPHETKEHPKHDIRNIRDYLKKVEAVKSKGTGWAAGVMRAAHCCRDSNLSEAQAMVELILWNQTDNVFPKFPLHELARACSKAYRVLKKGA